MWKILWKNAVSAEFRANRLKLCGNCFFAKYFHTRKLGEIRVFQRFLCSIASIKRAQASKKVALNTDYQFKSIKTFKIGLGLNSSEKKKQFIQFLSLSDLFTRELTKGIFTHWKSFPKSSRFAFCLIIGLIWNF